MIYLAIVVLVVIAFLVGGLLTTALDIVDSLKSIIAGQDVMIEDDGRIIELLQRIAPAAKADALKLTFGTPQKQ